MVTLIKATRSSLFVASHMIDRYARSPHDARLGELLACVLSLEILQYRFVALIVLRLSSTSSGHCLNSTPSSDLTAICWQVVALALALRWFA